MTDKYSKEIRSTVTSEGNVELSITKVPVPTPTDDEVLIEVHAAPISPSDLALLITFGGDLANINISGSGEDTVASMKVHPAMMKSMKSRLDQAMPAGNEGAGVVVDVGPGVKTLKSGDHVIPLYTAECRECDFCLNPKTNLCQAVRATQGQGVMPDGTSRFSYEGKPILHYMGCSTFSNYSVLPEISLAKVREDAPFDKICYIGCGVTTGIGAVAFTMKVEAGSTVAVFGLGGIGLNVIQGAQMVGATRIIGIDLNPSRIPLATQFGMTDFINPNEVENVVNHIIDMTGGGVDYSFECIGNVDVMRQALECCHKGWGESCIVGVAGAGKEIATRPFQLVTGRSWRGTAFGGARGRTDVPKIVDWYMDGKINIDDLITHKMPLEDINKAFDLMHAGKSIRSVVEF